MARRSHSRQRPRGRNVQAKAPVTAGMSVPAAARHVGRPGLAARSVLLLLRQVSGLAGSGRSNTSP
jgi:hypothetical protein